MSLSIQQEIAANGAVAALDAKLNLARAWIVAGTWVPAVGWYGEPDDALNALDRIQKAVDQTLAGPYLDKALDGRITWGDWVEAAEGYGKDVSDVVGGTGLAAELAALKQVPGDVATTVKEGVADAKAALPYVAAGAGLFLAVALAIVVIWELR